MLIRSDSIRTAGVLGVLMVLLPGCDGTAESHTEAPAGSSGHAAKSVGPESSAIKPTLDAGWCAGHGVPESVCTRCDAKLIAVFKQAGDWCGEHGLPESQCSNCNPGVRAAWAALQPQAEPTRSADVDWRVEPSARLVTGPNDPLCQIDSVRVRFVDAGILLKAGIEFERVERRAMSATVVLPAETEFDATRLTRITARISGVVRTVPVNVGDAVRAGDVLAVLECPALGEAKSEYITRQQDLRLAEADRDRIDTIARGVGRMLEMCTPTSLAEEIREALADTPIGAAKSELLRAHAALQLARTEAAREATLREKNISSERKYEAAQSALAGAEADFIAVREEITFDIQRQQLAAQRTREVAQSAFDASDRRLHILGLTDAQIAEIGTEPPALLSVFELHSPAAGRVVERTAVVGESVDAMDTLLVVSDLSTMWLMANATERDLVRLRIGQRALFTVDEIPGMSFEGRVAWISSRIDDQTRAVRVRVDLPNPDGSLRANMYGQARIVVHEDTEVVTVPGDAVQSDGCCQLVFVRESDTVFQPRKVVLGTAANGFVEVVQGLEAGDVVATAGSFLMKTEILKRNIGAGCCEVEPGR